MNKKWLGVTGSSVLAVVMTVSTAMAQDNTYREQRKEQLMEQDEQRQSQHMEKRENRFEKHMEKKEQNKEMYENRLKEKQDDGFRMKPGSGGGKR
jgi:membrane protein involved in colicin uptake